MTFDRGGLINNVAGLARAAKALGVRPSSPPLVRRQASSSTPSWPRSPICSDDKTFGLETMCVGGGQGMARIVERLL